ncbi:MAG: TIGR02611 family protein [Rhodococcus sp. (in: high G+C Gram-positive bacteria)]
MSTERSAFDHTAADGSLRDTSDHDSSESDDERSRYREWRDGIAARPKVDRAYRIAVAAVGTVVLVIGVIAIPYPGPGWLIVFTGLGILASEFTWAKTVLHWVRARYDTFMEWFGKQNMLIRGLGVLLTAAVVLATLWVLGALEMVGGWVGLDWPWLQSPL